MRPDTPLLLEVRSLILIFTTIQDPASTNVMRRLHELGEHDVLRINERDIRQRTVRIELGDAELRFVYGDTAVDLEAVSAVWYRKGNFWFDVSGGTPRLGAHPALAARLAAKLSSEDAAAREYFHYLLAARARTLGHAGIAQLNKLVVLATARAVGLLTPVSITANCSAAFATHLEAGARLVTKAMSSGMYLWDFELARTAYFSYTEQLASERLRALPPQLPLSFAQRQIDKDFEVRTFFLDGEFYSMAIFSQADATTAVDYRKYNFEKPNRNIPYQLPPDIEHKLTELFARLSLNTGSVDLIVDAAGHHHFLEINPSGQFDGLSVMCNYDLDGRIAAWLAGKHGH